MMFAGIIYLNLWFLTFPAKLIEKSPGWLDIKD